MAEHDEEPELDSAVEQAGGNRKAPAPKTFLEMVSLPHQARLHARLRRLDGLFAAALKEKRINDALAIEKQAGEILRLIPQPKAGSGGVGGKH